LLKSLKKFINYRKNHFFMAFGFIGKLFGSKGKKDILFKDADRVVRAAEKAVAKGSVDEDLIKHARELEEKSLALGETLLKLQEHKRQLLSIQMKFRQILNAAKQARQEQAALMSQARLKRAINAVNRLKEAAKAVEKEIRKFEQENGEEEDLLSQKLKVDKALHNVLKKLGIETEEFEAVAEKIEAGAGKWVEELLRKAS
jgi:hypothetical protein